MENIQDNSLCISIFTIYELIEGCNRSTYPREAEEKAFEVISELKDIVSDRRICILAGRIAGELKRKGRPIGDGDTIIGATALAHNLTIITKNEKHFKLMPGLKVELW